jgi:hypothetical protein
MEVNPRVLSQVEQARAYVSFTTRLRIYDLELPDFADDSNVYHLSVQCRGARTGDDRSDTESPVRNDDIGLQL